MSSARWSRPGHVPKANIPTTFQCDNVECNVLVYRIVGHDLTHPSRYYEGNTRRHVDSLEARITAVTNLIDLEEHYAQIGKSWKSTDVTDGEGKIILFQLFIVPEKDVNVLRMLGHHLLFNEQAFVSSSDWIMSPKSARNWQMFQTSFASLGVSSRNEANYVLSGGSGRSEKLFDSTLQLFMRSFEEGYIDPWFHEIQVGIIVEQAMSLANGTDEIKYPTIKESHDIQTSPSSEKSRGALAEESRKAFYMEMFESLYPSYFDARNFLNAPTVVLHISIDTFRRWGSVLGVVQSLVEELADTLRPFQGTRPAITSTSDTDIEFAEKIYSMITRLLRYDNMLSRSASSATQFAEESRGDPIFPDCDESKKLDMEWQEAERRKDTQRRKREWTMMRKNGGDLQQAMQALQRQVESLRAIVSSQPFLLTDEHALLLVPLPDIVAQNTKLNSNAQIRESQAATQLADEAVKQGASIKRITILTFVFLPLTFVAGLFGTNFKEFGQGQVPLWVLFATGIPVIGLLFLLWWWLGLNAKRREQASSA